MTIELWTQFFAWTSVINYIVLLIWSLILLFWKDWVFQFHRQWFRIELSQLERIHIAALATFKILIFTFSLVPYLALRLMQS